MQILTIKNLSKRFGNTLAVDDLSFSANSGELLAIVGPSGCGKTTLLRSIAGLENPDSGSISLDGRFIFHSDSQICLPPHQRRIGMVFQNYALWPHMNVFQNVAYPLRIRRVCRKKQCRAVKAALAQVRMSGYERRLINEISGGEQQRTALARALVLQPQILLLDEPLSNLDVHLREKMGSEIKRIQYETGLTVIHITHDQIEAMTLADRIVVMNKGRIMQIGRPEEIYRQPQSSFVAGFMGASNLVNCSLGAQNGFKTILLSGGSNLIIKSLQGKAAGPVTLSIRPEDIHISQNHEGVKGKILEIIYQGNLTRYRLTCSGIELKVQAAPGNQYKIGDEVSLIIQQATVIPDPVAESL